MQKIKSNQNIPDKSVTDLINLEQRKIDQSTIQKQFKIKL